MVENGSLWETMCRYNTPDYVAACIQVSPLAPGDPSIRSPCPGGRTFNLHVKSNPVEESKTKKAKVLMRSNPRRSCLSSNHTPFYLKVDPDRDACLDGETGLLVNHAYGLEDMKVCEKT